MTVAAGGMSREAFTEWVASHAHRRPSNLQSTHPAQPLSRVRYHFACGLRG